MRIRLFFHLIRSFFVAFVPFYSFLVPGHSFQACSQAQVNGRSEEHKPAPGQKRRWAGDSRAGVRAPWPATGRAVCIRATGQSTVERAGGERAGELASGLGTVLASSHHLERYQYVENYGKKQTNKGDL